MQMTNVKINKLNIKVFLGLHSFSSTNKLIPLLASFDLICIEAMGKESDKSIWNNVFASLASDESYIKSFAETYEKHKIDFGLRIAWGLRGKNKKCVLVDVSLPDEPSPEQLSAVVPFYDVDKVFDRIDKAPSSRYEEIRAFVEHDALKIRNRDKLVARQVYELLTRDGGKFYEERVKTDNTCEVAVIQGALHNVQPYLKQLFPGATITEELFNKTATEDFMTNDPGAKLLSKIVRDPSIKISNKEVDYYLYLITSNAIKTAPLNNDATPLETFTHMGSEEYEKADHTSGRMAALKQVKPIADFDAADLAALVEATIKEKPAN